MAYTQDDFEDWIILIDFKMDFFTGEFVKEQNLKLDYSIESLDELEGWILANYKEVNDLIADRKMLDYLTVYVGETIRKNLGGKWVIDLENKENVFYSMPVVINPDRKRAIHLCPLTLSTASIDRQKGNFISTVVKNQF